MSFQRSADLHARVRCAVLFGLGLAVVGTTTAVAAPGDLANLNVTQSPRALSKVGVPTVFTITVANAGPQAAVDVSVRISLGDLPVGSNLVPRGFASLRPSVGTCTEDMPVVCQIGTLPANDSEAVEVTFTPTSISTFYVQTRVASATTSDPDVGDNEATYSEYLGTFNSPYIGDRAPYIADFLAPTVIRPFLNSGVPRAEPVSRPAPLVLDGEFFLLLSEDVELTFAFDHQSTGRRVGGRWVAANRRNRSSPRCTRYTRNYIDRIDAHTGWNRIAFTGYLSGFFHFLGRPGRYRVTIIPQDGAGLRGSSVVVRTEIKPTARLGASG